MQAQRWGSGLPIDPNMVAEENVHEICGTTYASKVTGSLVYSSSEKTKENFVADDSIGLYYGGDFCSHLNPGFEAAALSGLDLAKHILRQKKLADCWHLVIAQRMQLCWIEKIDFCSEQESPQDFFIVWIAIFLINLQKELQFFVLMYNIYWDRKISVSRLYMVIAVDIVSTQIKT